MSLGTCEFYVQDDIDTANVIWAIKQGIDSPWTLIPNSAGPGEDVKTILPRFLLQDIIFAHCLYDDL